MTEIRRITTGFLVDNLFQETAGVDVEKSAERYQELVWDALEGAFPEVEDIAVLYQKGGGSLPWGLKTHVYFHGEPTYAEEEEATARVEQLYQEVFEDGAWLVEQEKAS